MLDVEDFRDYSTGGLLVLSLGQLWPVLHRFEFRLRTTYKAAHELKQIVQTMPLPGWEEDVPV